MKWIDIDEKLPEINDESNESDDVLVSSGNGSVVAKLTFYRAEGYRKTDSYHWSEQSTGCGCCGAILVPTHWCPIPTLKV